MANLGMLLKEAGRQREAETWLRQALEIFEKSLARTVHKRTWFGKGWRNNKKCGSFPRRSKNRTSDSCHVGPNTATVAQATFSLPYFALDDSTVACTT